MPQGIRIVIIETMTTVKTPGKEPYKVKDRKYHLAFGGRRICPELNEKNALEVSFGLYMFCAAFHPEVSFSVYLETACCGALHAAVHYVSMLIAHQGFCDIVNLLSSFLDGLAYESVNTQYRNSDLHHTPLQMPVIGHTPKTFEVFERIIGFAQNYRKPNKGLAHTIMKQVEKVRTQRKEFQETVKAEERKKREAKKAARKEKKVRLYDLLHE